MLPNQPHLKREMVGLCSVLFAVILFMICFLAAFHVCSVTITMDHFISCLFRCALFLLCLLSFVVICHRSACSVYLARWDFCRIDSCWCWPWRCTCHWLAGMVNQLFVKIMALDDIVSLIHCGQPSCLHCFDTVRWAPGRASGLQNWVMGCWCSYLSGARFRLFAYGPADASASQNPIISCLI